MKRDVLACYSRFKLSSILALPHYLKIIHSINQSLSAPIFIPSLLGSLLFALVLRPCPLPFSQAVSVHRPMTMAICPLHQSS